MDTGKNQVYCLGDGTLASYLLPNVLGTISVEWPLASSYVTLWDSQHSASTQNAEVSSTEVELGQLQGADNRAQLVQVCLVKAKRYLDKNDPMQASEKFYKCAEESVKYLAEHYQLDEVNEAKSEGQWWLKLLNRAAMDLAKKTKHQFIEDAWEKAFRAHMFGFHENAYSIADVKAIVPVVQKLVDYVREVDHARRKTNP